MARFDGNIDNLVQEMRKHAREMVQYNQETCLEAKEICLRVVWRSMNLSLDTGNDPSAL